MTAKPVPEHISDERLAEVRRLASVEENDCLRDGARSAAQYHADVGFALTELQHRREAEAGFREFAKLVDESPHPERSTHLSADARAQAAFAMLDNFKRQARALAASPSAPASGVRVKVKPLEWHGPDFEDEYWAASLDLKYVIHPPNERGVRWLGGVGGYFRLVDEAKSVAEKHNEARILSAIGEHP